MRFRDPRPTTLNPLFRGVLLSVTYLFLGSALLAQESPSVEAEASQTDSGGTEISIATDLVRLVERGGTPESIEQLRKLEEQQRRVADAAVACAVSISIGPAQGGGVIVTESGYILTAAHVAMRPGKPAIVTLSNGRRLRATTLGMNRNVDAGLIKINPGQNDGEPYPHATLGTSENLAPGMWCVATGHPGGYDGRRGPVTRIGRILAVADTAIVTDCALVGGDSGGPLFDLKGKLIAVHSRIGNDVADNLHVPIDYYDDSWDRMQAGEAWGYLPGFKPVIGVRGDSKSPKAEVSVVTPNSPAERAGIKVGDIIVEFGGITVTNFASLREAVAQTMPGERLRVWVIREGERRGITLEVGRASDQ